MSILTGLISRDGVVIDIMIGPSLLPSPTSKGSQAVVCRAVLDTGAGTTGVAKHLLDKLEIAPIGRAEVRVPVGQPQTTGPYRVRIGFVSAGTVVDFGDVLVIAVDCFDEHEEHQALIGRDVLGHCTFQYWGTAGTFHLAF